MKIKQRKTSKIMIRMLTIKALHVCKKQSKKIEHTHLPHFEYSDGFPNPLKGDVAPQLNHQSSKQLANKKKQFTKIKMVFKKGEKKSANKGSQDATKDTVAKKGPGRRVASKNRAETYSVYIYRVLK